MERVTLNCEHSPWRECCHGLVMTPRLSMPTWHQYVNTDHHKVKIGLCLLILWISGKWWLFFLTVYLVPDNGKERLLRFLVFLHPQQERLLFWSGSWKSLRPFLKKSLTAHAHNTWRQFWNLVLQTAFLSKFNVLYLNEPNADFLTLVWVFFEPPQLILIGLFWKINLYADYARHALYIQHRTDIVTKCCFWNISVFQSFSHSNQLTYAG